MFNNKRIIKLSIFLLFFIIVPASGAYFLFWDNVAIPATHKADNGKIIVTVNSDELLKPTLKNTTRKIFQTPFDLTFYNLCFNNYTRVTEKNAVEYINSNVIFEELNGDKLGDVYMPGNKETCVNFNSQSFVISSAGDVQYQFKYFPSDLRVDFDIRPDDKAQPVRSDRIASSILFLFAFWSLIFAFMKIWELLNSILNNNK